MTYGRPTPAHASALPLDRNVRGEANLPIYRPRDGYAPPPPRRRAGSVRRCIDGCSRYRTALYTDSEPSQATLFPERGELVIGRITLASLAEFALPAVHLFDLLRVEAAGARVLGFHLGEERRSPASGRGFGALQSG